MDRGEDAVDAIRKASNNADVHFLSADLASIQGTDALAAAFLSQRGTLEVEGSVLGVGGAGCLKRGSRRAGSALSPVSRGLVFGLEGGAGGRRVVGWPSLGSVC